MLHAGADLLADQQIDRLNAVFAEEKHVEVEATWGIHQRIIAAYRNPHRAEGKKQLKAEFTALSSPEFC